MYSDNKAVDQRRSDLEPPWRCGLPADRRPHHLRAILSSHSTIP